MSFKLEPHFRVVDGLPVSGEVVLEFQRDSYLTEEQVLAAHVQFGQLDWHKVKEAMGPNWPAHWENLKSGESIFIHVQPKTDACEHDFGGWRDFEDGNGGEQVCKKCGLGAMAHTLSIDF